MGTLSSYFSSHLLSFISLFLLLLLVFLYLSHEQCTGPLSIYTLVEVILKINGLLKFLRVPLNCEKHEIGERFSWV